ncbi:hypothetical protein E4U19_007986 [Claviceps sp. Clav32 group G5]|nr:hypothetical protein E4U19_007986 [Claviceps sp. Clav32 group G5]
MGTYFSNLIDTFDIFMMHVSSLLQNKHGATNTSCIFSIFSGAPASSNPSDRIGFSALPRRLTIGAILHLVGISALN